VSTAARTSPGQGALIEPDLGFVRALRGLAGESYRKCFQCGTCSATCGLSPEEEAFPRKEMAWALWGLKDRLLHDPDVWLCHQCNDCSLRCPRGSRPGDVLAAVRQACIAHYSVPRLLGRWVGRPRFVPILLGVPALVLALAALAEPSLQAALGITRLTPQIVFPTSPWFPHWLLNSVFGFFGLLSLLALVAGLVRFGRALGSADSNGNGPAPPKRPLAPALASTLRRIVLHEQFARCTTPTARSVSHVFVLFGFLALALVSLWVVTGRYNPLLSSPFVYPFGFFSPWKLLANLGGAALLFGCAWMIQQRLDEEDKAGHSTYFDWAFVATLGLVAVTGFVTEGLHLLRLVPHRHVAYFVHLVLALTLIVSLPYSKFAHLLYRAVAMVHAERRGRLDVAPPASAPEAGAGR
jgi:quinone-modifying oxidoreductase subunit QmoC